MKLGGQYHWNLHYSTVGTTLQDLLDKLNASTENQRMIDSITANTTMSDDEKKKAIIAARYLNSVGKGENALELCYALQENLNKKETADFKEFVVPPYIQSAIEELCQ